MTGTIHRITKRNARGAVPRVVFDPRGAACSRQYVTARLRHSCLTVAGFQKPDILGCRAPRDAVQCGPFGQLSAKVCGVVPMLKKHDILGDGS
jgi:hypothetical protein